ncbi:hypothetical protein [Persicobacter sp. CCB-QB2]|uniref:hypothetical protein n=1 Tax=Persicobacter sp. CCB-QB2 TaxID=1561025 RepID=UPI00155DBB85|nr:hypothetical protein [Persicobacter sp. CCB-QB2]
MAEQMSPDFETLYGAPNINFDQYLANPAHELTTGDEGVASQDSTQYTGNNKVLEDSPSLVDDYLTQYRIMMFKMFYYGQKMFVPSTGKGIFDVSLDPNTGQMDVLTKVNFDYINGDARKFAGLKNENPQWTGAEKIDWTRKFKKLVSEKWSNNFGFINNKLPGINVFVNVNVIEAKSDWHYQLRVKKIPEGTFDQSYVQHKPNARDGNKRLNEHYAALDSEDLTGVVKKDGFEKQYPASHEYGHMIGLSDEYPTSSGIVSHNALVKDALGKEITQGLTNDIMSLGNTIMPQHYVTFLEALQTITKDKKWEFKK